MALPRDCTKEEKARLFKEHSAEYLTADESRQVKVALAHFMASKKPAELVNRLTEVLTTPQKHNLYNTIGLFIPNKFFDEYESLWRAQVATTTSTTASTDDAGADSGADSASDALSLPTPPDAATTTTTVTAPSLPPQAPPRAESSQRGADGFDSTEAADLPPLPPPSSPPPPLDATHEAQAVEQLPPPPPQVMHEEQGDDAPADIAPEAPAPPKRAAAPAPAPPERASAPAPAPPERAAAPAPAPQERASAPAPAPHERAAAPAPAPQDLSSSVKSPPLPAESPSGRRLSQAELEAQRDEARARRARQREEEMKRRQAAMDANESGLVRSRTESVRGKRGGVAELRARMAAASKPQPKPEPVRMRHAEPRKKDSIVNRARQSHLEMIKKVSREGPVNRTEQLVKAEQLSGERNGGKIVIYTTSVTGIMETKIKCKEMRAIFQRLRVRFEERNIYMDKSLSDELEFRLPGATLPQAFFNGEHIGGFDEVLKLNETGELQKMTEKMEKIEVNITGDCTTCAGEGFTLCSWCGGNKRKSMAIQYNVPTRQTAFLKCTACNDNGLMMCPSCMTRPEDLDVEA